MQKTILDVSKEGIISNYLIYILADQIETLRMFSEKETQKAGFAFRKRDKILLDQIKYASIDLRKSIRETSGQSQLEFGDTSDSLLKLMLLIVDRAGENKSKYEMICNFLESINSEQNLNLKMFKL